MAIVHKATLTPPKPELLRRWLDRQPWGGSGELTVLGSYRFDDPDGEVGVEGLLARRGELVLHVPFTYRGAPLEGADGALVGTLDHSALGPRWVYPAAADPVALGCFERALRGEQQAAEFDEYDAGRFVRRRPQTVALSVQGDAAGTGEVRFADVVRPAAGLDTGLDAGFAATLPDDARRLVAAWDGGAGVVAALV